LKIEPFEYPVPTGLSKKSKLALLFQDISFFTGFPYSNLIGPFSKNMASSEEQPGPPVNHIINGSLSGFYLEGNSQKNISELSVIGIIP